VWQLINVNIAGTTVVSIISGVVLGREDSRVNTETQSLLAEKT